MEDSLEGEIRKKVVETLQTAESPMDITELRSQVLDKVGCLYHEEEVRDVVFTMIRRGSIRMTDDRKVTRG